jgi:S1-C subfamily serine protease
MKVLLACMWLAIAAWRPALATEVEDQSRALQRASDAVVGVVAVAVDDARSARTLGTRRQGSGVVIGTDDMVLTIGYLILEAERVMLRTDDGRELPARVVAYDLATGFGLVQALAPLKLAPAPLGKSARVGTGEPLVVASGGEDGAVCVAHLVSRRDFAGYWEYHIADAMFTTPARRDHSGAGLFNARGELVGIGSLFVGDALGAGTRTPGNMFVPVDLLVPVFDELRAAGVSRASLRAWMGVNCAESEGQVRVVRVNDDSPADVAGLQAGDQIERIDGTEVHTLAELWQALWKGRAEREVRLDVLRAGSRQQIAVHTVDRFKTLRRAQGI